MGGLLPVANVLGRLMMLFSLSYVVPIAGSLVYLDGMAMEFAIGMSITLGVGVALFLATRAHYRDECAIPIYNDPALEDEADWGVDVHVEEREGES